MKRTFRMVGLYICLAAAVTIIAYWLMTKDEEKQEIRLYSEGAVVYDLKAGKLLYEWNEHKQLHPASMTKMMSVMLVMDELAANRLRLDDRVVVSAAATGTLASKAGLHTGEHMTVEDLLLCVLLPSGSEAVYALAEHIAGDEQTFVQRMNDRALELQLTDTHFTNTIGLEERDHYSTPHDMAMLAAALVRQYPEIYQYTELPMATIHHEDGSELVLHNTNDMLHFNGVRGLKTGSTPNGGYSLTMGIEKDEQQYIIVVMGSKTPYFRMEDCKQLLAAYVR